MSDWLAVLSEDNWKVCAKRSLIGFSKRHQRKLAEMAVGDRLWIYISKQHVDRQEPVVRRLRAIATIRGPLHKLVAVPWEVKGAQTFSFARAITVDKSLDIDAVPILKKMSFAGRGSKWGVPLINAPLRLTTRDVAGLSAFAGRQ